MKSNIKTLMVLVGLVVVAASGWLLLKDQQPKTPTVDIVGLPVNQVCMVNDAFMRKEQIPVLVNGKTYFGCCEMCKGQLQNNPAVRSSKDPFSGEEVDKTEAFIVLKNQGKDEVLYFKSKSNAEKYFAKN